MRKGDNKGEKRGRNARAKIITEAAATMLLPMFCQKVIC